MEKAKKKSILSEKQKKIINAVVIALELIIVVVAIGFSISILLSTGYETTTDFGDASVRLMPVLTGSMEGDNPDSFNAGDLIIVNKATDESIAALEVGDIVTYVGNVGGARGFITHRIVDIEESDSGVRTFYTKGDAEAEGVEPTAIYAGDIKGIYSSKIAGVGSALGWLQEPTHFFLVVMLPLILLLVYNAYLVIRMVVEAKLKKQQEQAQAALAAAQSNAALDEEEIKRRAIEEYLASQNAGAQAAPEQPVEQPEAEQKEDGKKEPPQE